MLFGQTLSQVARLALRLRPAGLSKREFNLCESRWLRPWNHAGGFVDPPFERGESARC